jgi:uncharacterized protein YutE (UPF0331/DUF86 family)
LTLRSLDPATVQAKLRLLQGLLDDLANAEPVTGERMRDDRLLRHAIERILTQLVELAVSINGHVVAARLDRAPDSYRQSFADVAETGLITTALAERLSPAVGMRNLLVHEYAVVDLDRVADAIPEAVSDFGAYVRSVARWLAAQESP